MSDERLPCYLFSARYAHTSRHLLISIQAKDVAEKDDWVTALKNAMYEAATVVGPLQPSSSTVSDAR